MKRNAIFSLIITVMLVPAFGIPAVFHDYPVFAAIEAGSESGFKKPTGYSPEIAPYINFLKTGAKINPVDYVINLFDKYDMVVLCERDHRDITQYELIYQIVSDPRFIEKSGNVFTEIGSRNINDKLNTLLKTGNLNETEDNEELISIYRDLSWGIYWEKYNLFDFLRRVYFLNNTLPDTDKVNINLSDIPIDWNGMTKEKYQSVLNIAYSSQRDKVMADYIIERYKEIEKSKPQRKKILVIMNYRHAFKLFDGNTTEYLNKKFPGKIANVMINSLMPGSDGHNDICEPIQDGKWDAAFRYLNNPNTAFDFKDTPFGKDHFDYFDFIPHEYTYQDIFNGFVFYYPLEKHLLVTGIPGFVDEKFFPILIGRVNVVENTSLQSNDPSLYNEFEKGCNEKKEQHYPDIMKYNSEIEEWLKYSE